MPLWFNRKIQFQIKKKKLPRFDLHVLHVLNSIIKSPKSKISNYISSVWIDFIGIDSFLSSARQIKEKLSNFICAGFIIKQLELFCSKKIELIGAFTKIDIALYLHPREVIFFKDKNMCLFFCLQFLIRRTIKANCNQYTCTYTCRW